MKLILLSLLLIFSTEVFGQQPCCEKIDCDRVTGFFNTRDKLPELMSEYRWPLGDITYLISVLETDGYFTRDEVKGFMAEDSLLGETPIRCLKITQIRVIRGKRNLERWRKTGLLYSSVPYFSADNQYALVRERTAEYLSGSESLRIFQADGGRWKWIRDVYYESFHE